VVSVISTATDEVTTSIDVGTMPRGLAITPDGSRVVVAGFGTDQVEAIDTGTNQVTWTVPVPQPHNLAITRRRPHGVCRQSEGGLPGIGNH
jgi:YVTN family beta-propeller protein